MRGQNFGSLLNPMRGRPDLVGKIFLPPEEAKAYLMKKALAQIAADQAAQSAVAQGAIPATGEIVTASAPPPVVAAPVQQMSAPIIDAPGYVVTQSIDDFNEPNLDTLYGQTQNVPSAKSGTGKRPRSTRRKKGGKKSKAQSRKTKPVKKRTTKKRAKPKAKKVPFEPDQR